jgi:hypothetical protein
MTQCFSSKTHNLVTSFATSAYKLLLLHTAHVDLRLRGTAINPANYTRIRYKIQTDAQYNGMRDKDYMISKITKE